MATDAVRSQVAAKWQESFNRLNGSAPGISGLLSFSEVCVYVFLLEKHLKRSGIDDDRRGILRHSFCILEISG